MYADELIPIPRHTAEFRREEKIIAQFSPDLYHSSSLDTYDSIIYQGTYAHITPISHRITHKMRINHAQECNKY